MASSETPPEVVEDPKLRPDCPHCGKALTRVSARALTSSGGATVRFGKRFAYACPHCNKLLGISHRKGFWMG